MADKVDFEGVKEEVEGQLLELPIIQYAWLSCSDIPFSENARMICQQECPRYGKSWSCPPGVGTVEECKARCMKFEGAFVFSTIAEVNDIMNMDETLATLKGHEEVTHEIVRILGQYTKETLPLSGDSCAACEKCTYPDAPCRQPGRMVSCIEGYGIIVPLLAEKAGIDFENGSNIVTWFGMVLYR